MTREERIIQAFVVLANTMVDEFDIVDFLHSLAERCAALLDCTEAGLMLADANGALRVMASSSERSEALELLQIQNGEGPCHDCFHCGAPVHSADLALEMTRWPAFAPAALEHGFHSVQAIPMRVRGETVGALNLFRAAIGSLSERDLPLAQGIADIAAIGLMQERTLRESRSLVGQLQGALNSRVVIEQAKGILAERAHVTVDEAFAALRAHARSSNTGLGKVAVDIVEARLDASALL